MLAPVLPHTADEAYKALWAAAGDDPERSVHLKTFARLDAAAPDEGWSAVLAARDEALKALEDAKGRGVENPLDAEVVFADPDGVLSKFAADLPDRLE